MSLYKMNPQGSGAYAPLSCGFLHSKNYYSAASQGRETV